MSDDLVKRVCVCGVDCLPGDSRCNGYCKGDAGHAAIYEVSSHQAPTGSNADEWALFLRDNTTEYCAVQIADRIEALQAERCVEVRHLVWEYHPAGMIASDNAGSSYIIDTRGKRPAFIRWPMGFAPEIEDIEAAKAAAQADYEHRILATLTTRPASEVRAEAHAAAVEAAAELVRPNKTERDAPEFFSAMNDVLETRFIQIRTLHTDASLAAIERIKREAREEALREAAEILASRGMSTREDWDRYRAIMALIEKEGV